MQSEIQALSKVQADISSYEKQQGVVENTGKKLEVLKQQYDNIKKEMAETEVFSSRLENQLLTKQQQIDKTSDALTTHKQKLNQMGSVLTEAGVDTDRLAESSAKLGEKIEGIKADQIKAVHQAQREAAESTEEYGVTANQAFLSAGQALTAAGIALALKKIKDSFMECANAAMEYESALTGVEKTTDLTSAELGAMSAAIRALSKEIPMAATELAGITENAGQLGIAKENLVGFTRTMADLGVATNLTGEDAAQTFAKFANITQMSQGDFDRLGSTVVDLGNNLATTEKDIAAMGLRLAAAGKQAGMSEADILGLAGSLSSVGLEAQAGGTAFSKAINQITIAVETGNDNLADFSRIAGMSAQEFATAWGRDAAGAMVSFTQGLADAERHGKSTVVLLEELGMTEIRLSDAMRRAAGSGDLFRNSIELGNAAWAENTALTKEAELRYSTTESQLQLLKNSYQDLKVAIGDNYTPALKDLYSAGTDVLNNMTAFVEENPELVKAFSTFGIVLGGTTALLVGYTAAAKVATIASTAMKAAIPGVNIILGATAAVTGLVVGIEALREAEERRAFERRVGKENVAEYMEMKQLSAASQEQYHQMKALEERYNSIQGPMAETTAEAQLLKKELDNATEAYENNKQTAEEAAEAHRESMEAYEAFKEAQRELVAGAEAEGQSILSLTNRLDKLVDAEGKAVGSKEELLAIVELLNEKMPELGLVYDEDADKFNKKRKLSMP
ncbi:MAG: phage tail tape measure protein [Oscillospiraceae bacterium]|nr:phage tail tape measure protein [Oscillospiraceae bacterium]